MGKIKYFLKMFKGANYEGLKHNLKVVKEESGQGKLRTLCSMAYCFIRYGAGHNDYVISAFYGMKHKNRKTFLTRTKNKKLIEALNDSKYSRIFENKSEFNARFIKYLRRGFLDAEKASFEEFKDFVNKYDVLFCKPPVGDSGRGIEKLSLKDFKDEKEMYEHIREKKNTCMEEAIIQHEEMARVNPHAVNCVRVVTVINNEGQPEIPYIVVKFGVGTHFIDNMGTGTWCAPVDVNTGIVTSYAFTEHGDHSEVHPTSNIKFEGIKIPLFNEMIEFIKEAAKEIPQVRQVGWDIAIGENGPCIVEGNEWTDYLFWQRPEQTKERIGLIPYYKKFVPDL